MQTLRPVVSANREYGMNASFGRHPSIAARVGTTGMVCSAKHHADFFSNPSTTGTTSGCVQKHHPNDKITYPQAFVHKKPSEGTLSNNMILLRILMHSHPLLLHSHPFWLDSVYLPEVFESVEKFPGNTSILHQNLTNFSGFSQTLNSQGIV